MKSLLSHIRNRWNQYTNRIFLSGANNIVVWYKSLMFFLQSFDLILEKKLKTEEPCIFMVTEDFLIRTIVFLYALVTHIDLYIVSPKRETATIVNAMISRTGVNVIILDKRIENAIVAMESAEDMSVLRHFKYVETSGRLRELISDNDNLEYIGSNSPGSKIFKKGLTNIFSEGATTKKVSILSPGTTNMSSFANIAYPVLIKAAKIAAYFTGIKAGDKVCIIADFESFPGLFTVFPILTGAHLLYLKDNDIQSGEDLKEQLSEFKLKPAMVMITSAKFKRIWDSAILKVYSNRFMFWLAGFPLLERVPDYFVLREIRNIFGKSVNKVHILNEELGFSCINILRRSKIMFTSSYGFLEQGNFLAFKDPKLFKDRHFAFKPGGSILKNSEELFDNVVVANKGPKYIKENRIVAELTVKVKLGDKLKELASEDLALFIQNIKDQGERAYLYIFGRKDRYLSSGDVNASLELVEREIKDSLYVRDCFLIKIWGVNQYNLYIEPREELLAVHKIPWPELETIVQSVVNEITDEGLISISKYAILKFDGFRSHLDKIQFFTL
jgi:hypothetical protein